MVAKLNLLRKLGNTAVHQQQPIAPGVALDALRQLFHVMVWVGFHHSPARDRVPTQAQFDPSLAPKQAPLTVAELQGLAAKLKTQDEAIARARADNEALVAKHEAEIAALQEQIKAAQAASTKQVDDHDYSEAETRRL